MVKTLTEEAKGKALTAGEGSKFLETVGMEIPKMIKHHLSLYLIQTT